MFILICLVEAVLNKVEIGHHRLMRKNTEH